MKGVVHASCRCWWSGGHIVLWCRCRSSRSWRRGVLEQSRWCQKSPFFKEGTECVDGNYLTCGGWWGCILHRTRHHLESIDNLVLHRDCRNLQVCMSKFHSVGDDFLFSIRLDQFIAPIVVKCWAHIETLLSPVIPRSARVGFGMDEHSAAHGG